jgi:hypothetical protein
MSAPTEPLPDYDEIARLLLEEALAAAEDSVAEPDTREAA